MTTSTNDITKNECTYRAAIKFGIITENWFQKLNFSLTPEPIAQTGRWLAIMEEFDFEVQHRAGSRHQNADGLSRCPTHLECEETADTESSDTDTGAATRAVRRGIELDPDYRTRTSTGQSTADKGSYEQRIWHVYTPA